MGYNSEAPYAVGPMVGTNWGRVMHKTGFLGDPRLLMNLNKDTTRFLIFVSSANKPVLCWRSLLCKEEREENAALCSQSHQTRSAVAPAGASAGSQVQKTGACLWLFFSKEEKAASHIPSHLLELSLDHSGRRTWALQCFYHPFLVCRTQAPGTEKKSP